MKFSGRMNDPPHLHLNELPHFFCLDWKAHWTAFGFQMCRVLSCRSTFLAGDSRLKSCGNTVWYSCTPIPSVFSADLPGLTFRLDWMLRPVGLALHPVLWLRIETSASDKHNPLPSVSAPFLSRDKLQQLRHNRYNGGGLKDILRVPKHQHEANNVCVGLRITSQVHVCMIPSLIATDLSKWYWCRIAQCLPF